jgi:hypothetical protein
MSNISELLRNNPLAFANRAHVQLHGSRLDKDLYLRLLAYDLEEDRCW